MSKDLKDVLSTKKEIVIGDRKFVLKSICLSDLADFQEWCLLQKKKEIIEVYKLAEIDISVKEIMAISADQQYYDQKMDTLNGVIYLLYKVIRRYNDTNITIDELSSIIDINQIEQITSVLFGDFLKKEDKPKNVRAKSKIVKK